MLDTISPYLLALLPTVGVAFLFYWIIKYMIEADRRERKALAAWRKEHDRLSEQGEAAHPADGAENDATRPGEDYPKSSRTDSSP